MSIKTTTIAIEGMSCGGCVNAVKNVLGRMPGVSSADVKVGEAKITFDDARVDEAKLRAALAEAGYTPRAS